MLSPLVDLMDAEVDPGPHHGPLPTVATLLNLICFFNLKVRVNKLPQDSKLIENNNYFLFLIIPGCEHLREHLRTICVNLVDSDFVIDLSAGSCLNLQIYFILINWSVV